MTNPRNWSTEPQLWLEKSHARGASTNYIETPVPREGGGKSGGFRTVYVFGGRDIPIFLITVFAKNEKANLSPKEQAIAVELSKEIIEIWRNRK